MGKLMYLTAVALILLFWAIGAYNRLAGLRTHVVKKFEPVNEQFKLRHALLLEWAQMMSVPSRTETEATTQALSAACRQAEVACAHANSMPTSASAIGSLRLSENILSDVREHQWGQDPAVDLSADLRSRLVKSDATLTFARQQFNEAVQSYNLAVSQYPTALIAGVLGFQKAGLL